MNQMDRIRKDIESYIDNRFVEFFTKDGKKMKFVEIYRSQGSVVKIVLETNIEEQDQANEVLASMANNCIF